MNNPQLNQLLDKQRAQFDINERKTTIREIESICAEEQYGIYFSTDTHTCLWNHDIQHYRPSRFFPYAHVMRKTRRDRYEVGSRQ